MGSARPAWDGGCAGLLGRAWSLAAAQAGALGAPEPHTEVLMGGMLPALQGRWEEKYLQGLGNRGCFA